MSTSQRIVVDPITRIEGHLRIEAETAAEAPFNQAFSRAGEYQLSVLDEPLEQVVEALRQGRIGRAA